MSGVDEAVIVLGMCAVIVIVGVAGCIDGLVAARRRKIAAAPAPVVIEPEIVPPGDVVVARGVFSDDDVCELLARDMMRRRGLVGDYRAVFLIAKNRRRFTSQIRVELWRKPEQAESWQDGGQT